MARWSDWLLNAAAWLVFDGRCHSGSHLLGLFCNFVALVLFDLSQKRIFEGCAVFDVVETERAGGCIDDDRAVIEDFTAKRFRLGDVLDLIQRSVERLCM